MKTQTKLEEYKEELQKIYDYNRVRESQENDDIDLPSDDWERAEWLKTQINK